MHVCTCGDCETAPFEDRCKYEAALIAIVRLARDDPYEYQNNASFHAAVYIALRALDQKEEN